jgi:hypothetical protein
MDAMPLEDTLGLTAELEAIIASRLPLQALPVREGLERLEGPFGWEDLHLYTAPKIDRLSIHRFFIAGRLKEHLCLAWPGDDYDIPALGLDIYERADDFTLVADWIPFRDLAYAPDYYARYMTPFAELVAERWPALMEHVRHPSTRRSRFSTGNSGRAWRCISPFRAAGWRSPPTSSARRRAAGVTCGRPPSR